MRKYSALAIAGRFLPAFASMRSCSGSKSDGTSSAGSSSSPYPFTLGGSPLRVKGSGKSITNELLRTSTYSGEPMIIHCISGYISTLFLAEYPERGECLLLDTGMPSDYERVKFYVEQAVFHGKKKFADVMKLVVSTHCHIDHIGAGYYYGMHGIPVVTTRHFERYYAGWQGRMQHECDRALSLTVAWRLGRRYESVLMPRNGLLTPQGHKPLPQLDEGHTVPFFEDWVAIKCPGHTGHMVMLYHPPTHILYAADFLILHNKEYRAPLPTEIEFAYNHTVHRLRSLPVRYVLLAHQGTVNVEDIAGGWNFILDEVVRHMSKEPTSRLMRVVMNVAVGWSLEPKQFSRDELPHGPLPAACPDPQPIFHLR